MFKKRTIKRQESSKRKIDLDIKDDIEEQSHIKESQPKKLKKDDTSVKEREDEALAIKVAVDKEPFQDAITESQDNEATVDTSKKEPNLSAIPVNIRTTVTTDFQPDVCKDYKLTGYCGYGDTCKFLHIRGEMRAKKPIVKEWENVKVADESKKKEEVPFKCVLCKEDYKSPIRTVCNHYFCRECFGRRYKSKKTCIICGQNTEGIMNPVSDKVMKSLIK